MDLIQQGFLLLIVGLAVVLIFLSLIIGWIYLSSMIIRHFNFDRLLSEPAPSGGASIEATGSSSDTDDERIMAVISAAVRKYREDHFQRR